MLLRKNQIINVIIIIKIYHFKSLGPILVFKNLNYLFERCAVAFKMYSKKRDAINMISVKPNTINILDVGSGAGILSIFAARTVVRKINLNYLKQRLNVVWRMKPVAMQLGFFALFHGENNDSDDDNNNNNNDDVPTTMFTVESTDKNG